MKPGQGRALRQIFALKLEISGYSRRAGTGELHSHDAMGTALRRQYGREDGRVQGIAGA